MTKSGTINEFYEELSKYMDENPSQRKGQATFNLMYILHPKEADVFRGGANDPFNNSSKSDFFIKLCFNILFFDVAKETIKMLDKEVDQRSKV
jgi:hypothetical protein